MLVVQCLTGNRQYYEKKKKKKILRKKKIAERTPNLKSGNHKNKCDVYLTFTIIVIILVLAH